MVKVQTVAGGICVSLLLSGCTNTPPPDTFAAEPVAAVCEEEPMPGPFPQQNWSSLTLAKEIQAQRDKVSANYIAALLEWGQACASVAKSKVATEKPAETP